ncbi:MAG: biotin/lipoyl-containing protein, partial [Burkholderiaceae bacterium]
MSDIEVKVPDIGDFKNVEVIELLVKQGDTIAKDQSLITVESDKASMEIPSSSAGVIKQLRVKLGDKVSTGSPLLLLEVPLSEAPAVASPAPVTLSAAPAAESSVSSESNLDTPDIDCDVLVLGAGPGGYSAAFRAADLGNKTVLVERYSTLGGVCLNVGCIPSKALLHVAAVMDEAAHFAEIGVAFGEPALDLAKLRAHKTKVVGKLTGGLNTMAKARKVTVVHGVGTFTGPHRLQVDSTEGEALQRSGSRRVIRFAKAIIAAGSQAVKLPF